MDKKLVEEYLKCDVYMYAPLVVDQGTTNPSSGTTYISPVSWCWFNWRKCDRNTYGFRMGDR